MDYITIKNLKIFAHHGVLPEETKNGQDFYVNAKLYLDLSFAGKTDDLTQSVHYGEVSLFIEQYMKQNTFQLLESVAENMSRAILLAYPLIEQIDLSISKPNAPIPLCFEDVSVSVTRKYETAILAVGSNIGDKEGFLQLAVDELQNAKGVTLLNQSSILRTEPYGGVEMDEFLNGVFKVRTVLSPLELLDLCHTIEQKAGRERTIHWGPRTLDLDIIFYGQLIMKTRDLIIPHIDMCNRDFVLEPLNEIEPGWIHPVYQKTVWQLFEEYKKVRE